MKNTRTHEPCGIMITGGAGFIASHVALRLLERYPTYKIIILDSLEYCSNLKNIGRAIDEKLVTFVKGDIRSADLVNHLMVQHKIDTVLHFAAETHVDNSFGNSFAFTQTNVLGTHVLLESSVRNKIKRFLHVSTDEVYGESSFTTSRSNCETTSLLAPTNPYSASKAAAEMLVMAYGQSYGLPYVITRGNNVFGPHQYPEKAIPKFIFLLRSNKKIALHGDGSTLRSYMHVSDAASAFDVVLHYGKTGQVYNIGAKEERTIKSVAEDVCNLMNKNTDENIFQVRDRAFNDRRYFVDVSKLCALGWNERTSWLEGLRQTVEWYCENNEDNYWGDVSAVLKPHPNWSGPESHNEPL